MSIKNEASTKRDSIDEYIVKVIAEFEAGWLIHETQLKKYELTQAKLTEWDEHK
jgi:UDP-N-acetylenolpyruvoylglucosamine reductase